MVIKNFQADSMHEAMKRVKSEFGDNAVILNSQVIEEKSSSGLKSKKRFEITAGKDIPASRFAKQAVPARSTQAESSPHRKTDKIPSDVGILIRRFEKEINYLVESQKEIRALLKVSDAAKPVFAALEMHDLDMDILGRIFDQNEAESDSKRVDTNVIRARLLNLCVPSQPIRIFGSGTNKVAFVGPPGVGKTALIGKISAQLVFESKLKTTLINMDEYKPSAVSDLQTYARILKIDCHEQSDWIEKRFDNEFNVVLADTGGIPVGKQDDLELQVEKLEKFNPDEVHLVLPAYSSWREISRWIEFYRPLHPTQVAVTFMDQTESFGLPFNVAGYKAMKLSYFSWGRNKQEFLEEAELFSLSEKLFRNVGEGNV